MITKGICLAGGSGTRLRPLTSNYINKQILPIYDKPMIFYPLNTLVQAGIQEILIITTVESIDNFKDLLGNEFKGAKLFFAIQEKPDGLAQALLIAEDFLNGEGCVFILGDNVILDEGIEYYIKDACVQDTGGVIFGYKSNTPEKFGVIVYKDHKVVGIVEKPKMFISNKIVIGLYVYDKRCVDFARNLTKSARGEYEITDINNKYIESGELKLYCYVKEWYDCGNFDALLDCAIKVRERQNAI